MMMRGMIGLAACMVAAFGAGAEARAETFKDKGGIVTFVITSMENAKQPDGSIVARITSTGVSIADLPFPFDYMKSECAGTLLISADGKVLRSRGVCEALSSKGDRAAYAYAGDAIAGRLTWIEGAGAYAGIKGATTYKPKAALPGGTSVYEWTGSWQTD